MVMTHDLAGMVVRLKTSQSRHSGTDDHIYIGVVGTGGGREFPLDVKGFNDFEQGTDIRYWFGSVWDGTALSNARKPNKAESGDWNDPQKFSIDMNQIQSVYIRKQGDRSGSADDAYKLDEVEVTLYGANSPQSRTFSTTNDLWFGNEFGHQAWLPED